MKINQTKITPMEERKGYKLKLRDRAAQTKSQKKTELPIRRLRLGQEKDCGEGLGCTVERDTLAQDKGRRRL